MQQLKKLNKGGQLQGKVVNFDATSFVIVVHAPGHEDHEQEITLPRTLWRGPGAVIGASGYEPYEKENPRSAPRAGDSVIYDSDVVKAAQEKEKAASA